MKNLKLRSHFLYTLLVAVFLFGCNDSYTERTKYELQNMKEPIILKDKEKMTLWYSVILQDGTGKLYKWGNVSSLANSIGEMYEVNDTIPK